MDGVEFLLQVSGLQLGRFVALAFTTFEAGWLVPRAALERLRDDTDYQASPPFGLF